MLLEHKHILEDGNRVPGKRVEVLAAIWARQTGRRVVVVPASGERREPRARA